MAESEDVISLKRRRSEHLTKLSEQLKEMEQLMLSRANLSKVKDSLAVVCKQFDMFKYAHTVLSDSLSDSLRGEFETNFESQSKNFAEFCERVNQWLTAVDDRLETLSNASELSVRLKEAQCRRARAKLQLKQLSAKHELEQAQIELTRKQEALRLRNELEEAELEELVFSEEVTDSKQCQSRTGIAGPGVPAATTPIVSSNIDHSLAGQGIPMATHPTTETVIDNESAPHHAFPTATNNSELTSTSHSNMPDVNNTFELLVRTMQQGFHLPKPELLTFDGNPMDYCKFIHNFNSNITEKVSDDYTRLNYLIQYCKGDARNSIEECVLLNPQQGFKKALSILYDYYGRPSLVAESYICKIVKGPQLKSDDIDGLVELSKDMTRCEITLSQMGYVSELNNSINLRKIVQRLPGFLRAKWVDKADIIMESGREPTFLDLTEFVRLKARANRSIYGLDLANKGRSTLKTSSNNSSKFSNSYNKGATTLVAQAKSVKTCKCCSKLCKNLSECETFKNLSLSERRKLLRVNKLCDNCFKYKHVAKDCWSKSRCTVPQCTRKHHTLLHQWINEKSNFTDQTSVVSCLGSVPCDERKVSMSMVPV